MLFNGRNEVPFGYSCYGYTRSNGSVWHGGIDIVGNDSSIILMPSYAGKSISGTVVTSRIVSKTSGDLTWEWGYYVCVKLDDNQTPDLVNYLYFCHNEKNLVSVGAKVKTGDNIAIMGNSGNAELAVPPIKHVHFEVRQYSTTKGLDPTKYIGFENKAGVFGQALEENEIQTEGSLTLYEQKPAIGKLKSLYNINIRSAPSTNYEIIGKISANTNTPYYEILDNWARVEVDGVYGWIMAIPYAEVE